MKVIQKTKSKFNFGAKRGVNARAVLAPMLALTGLAGLASIVTLGAVKNADAISAIFSVEVPGTPVLEVTLDQNAVALTMAPTMATSDFQTGTFTVSAGTSSAKGYTLSLEPSSTALTNANGGTIDSITLDTTNYPNGYTEANFESLSATTNKWGYKMSTSDYYIPIPTEAVQLAKTNAPSDPSPLSVDFATKIDAHQAAGTYDVVLNFVAVANTIADINSIQYMQDLNAFTADDIAALKDTMTVNESYKLTDTRDGQIYWVTKLKTSSQNPRVTASEDGNKYQIWMTQNLNLNLTRVTDTISDPATQLTLNSNNTDINSNAGIYTTDYYTDTAGVKYWNPGRTTDTAVASTANSQTAPYSLTDGDKYYYADQSASETCTDSDGQKTCMHWHVGNYYNWTAAVASSDSTNQSTDGQEANNSICPAGWRLPSGITTASGGLNGGAGSSDFGYLLVEQGITSSFGTAGQQLGWNTDGYVKIQSSPLYTTRSGEFYGGSLYNQASYGLLWSGTTYSGTIAYYLGYNSSGVSPANGSSRQNGFPVRCIARELK